MKIAFATQDQQRVDAHFGWAKHLAVYEISPAGYGFVQDFGFGEDLAEDGNEDKLAPKLEAIKDCAIVYVAAGVYLVRLARSGPSDGAEVQVGH